ARRPPRARAKAGPRSPRPKARAEPRPPRSAASRPRAGGKEARRKAPRKEKGRGSRRALHCAATAVRRSEHVLQADRGRANVHALGNRERGGGREAAGRLVGVVRAHVLRDEERPLGEVVLV